MTTVRQTRTRHLAVALAGSGRQALGAALLGAALATAPGFALAAPAAATGASSVAAPSPAADANDANAADGGASPIVVTGTQTKKDGVSAGALGARPLIDVPFSVGAVDSDAIQRIAATTIDAAFAYDAGIRSNNSGVASGNTFSVRGIPIDRTNGYKVDGLPFPYWFQDYPIENLQALEVLKGAGGFAYGFAAPGGIVNIVSLQPTRKFEASFTTTWRSSSILNEHLDVGGPLDADGKVLLRFNAVNEEGRLYNGAFNKDQFASLALVAHPTE